MSKQLILIDTDLSAVGFKSVCDLAPGRLEALQSLENYFVALSGGLQSADVTVSVGAVGASATFTVSSTGSTAAQAGTLLTQALTAKASGAIPANGEFNVSATPATQAASMETAIIATLGSLLDVSRNGAVVTVTAKVPGVLTNSLIISAGNLANVVAAPFTGGSDGTQYVIPS